MAQLDASFFFTKYCETAYIICRVHKMLLLYTEKCFSLFHKRINKALVYSRLHCG